MKNILFYETEEASTSSNQPAQQEPSITSASPYTVLELVDGSFANFNQDYADTIDALGSTVNELSALLELNDEDFNAQATESLERANDVAKLANEVAAAEKNVADAAKQIAASLGVDTANLSANELSSELNKAIAGELGQDLSSADSASFGAIITNDAVRLDAATAIAAAAADNAKLQNAIQAASKTAASTSIDANTIANAYMAMAESKAAFIQYKMQAKVAKMQALANNATGADKTAALGEIAVRKQAIMQMKQDFIKQKQELKAQKMQLINTIKQDKEQSIAAAIAEKSSMASSIAELVAQKKAALASASTVAEKKAAIAKFYQAKMGLKFGAAKQAEFAKAKQIASDNKAAADALKANDAALVEAGKSAASNIAAGKSALSGISEAKMNFIAAKKAFIADKIANKQAFIEAKKAFIAEKKAANMAKHEKYNKPSISDDKSQASDKVGDFAITLGENANKEAIAKLKAGASLAELKAAGIKTIASIDISVNNPAQLRAGDVIIDVPKDKITLGQKGYVFDFAKPANGDNIVFNGSSLKILAKAADVQLQDGEPLQPAEETAVNTGVQTPPAANTSDVATVPTTTAPSVQNQDSAQETDTKQTGDAEKTGDTQNQPNGAQAQSGSEEGAQNQSSSSSTTEPVDSPVTPATPNISSSAQPQPSVSSSAQTQPSGAQSGTTAPVAKPTEPVAKPTAPAPAKITITGPKDTSGKVTFTGDDIAEAIKALEAKFTAPNTVYLASKVDATSDAYLIYTGATAQANDDVVIHLAGLSNLDTALSSGNDAITLAISTHAN